MNKVSTSGINRAGLAFWSLLAGGGLSLFLLHPELFEPTQLRRFFSLNLEGGLALYFVISTLRGFTLVPSTPLVLAGVLVFPPLPLWLVNQAAVYTSSYIVYAMTHLVGFDRYFHQRYPGQMARLTTLLKHRELPVISLWGFAPFVPSDLIVSACSILRISLWKTLLGISIGEGLICALYIFGGAFGLHALGAV